MNLPVVGSIPGTVSGRRAGNSEVPHGEGSVSVALSALFAEPLLLVQDLRLDVFSVLLVGDLLLMIRL